MIQAGPKKVRVATYSPIDPLSMPKQLFDVLFRFDGRETETVLAEIATKDGVRVSPGLVKKLGEFGILSDD